MLIRNCVRTVAIAMIVFPEPVTTALGIAILSATFALPGGRGESGTSNTQELLRRSLRSSDPPRRLRYFQLQEQPVYHPRKESAVVVGIGSAQQAAPAPVRHHTLKTSLPQYEARIKKPAKPSSAQSYILSIR